MARGIFTIGTGKTAIFLPMIIAIFIGANFMTRGAEETSAQLKTARDLIKNANYRDALAPLTALIDNREPLNRLDQVQKIAAEILHCYLALNEPDNAERALQKIAAQFPDQPARWRYLFAAARAWRDLPHYGTIFADKFTRNSDRQGEPVSAFYRDRAQILQWLTEAQRALSASADTAAAERLEFYAFFAESWQFGDELWRLQLLTALDALPDYDFQTHGRPRYNFHRGEISGAPVDNDGKPILYAVPADFSAAQNDGERWRWCLRQISANAETPAEKARENLALLQFSAAQFGLPTLGAALRGDAAAVAAFFAGALALDTLSDNEAVARLASGVSRFTLPDAYAPQVLRQKIFADGDTALRRAMAKQLADEYRERRQYDRALAWYEKLQTLGDTSAAAAIAQITGKWAKFEPTATDRPRLVFRNAQKVLFSAHRIRIEELLQDTREEIRLGDDRHSEKSTEINDVGRRLVFAGETAYIGEKAAEWEMPLPQDANAKKYAEHSLLVRLPDNLPAGGYLLEAKIPDGNIARIVIWKESIALVQKTLAGKVLYFAADAQTGAPVANLPLTAWGYRRIWRDRQLGHKFQERTLQKTTDANGCAFFTNADLRIGDGGSFTWLITAKNKDDFAYHGFTGMWAAPDPDADEISIPGTDTRSFIITDRPAYRPGDAVKIKVWTRDVDYAIPVDAPARAGAAVLQIIQPNGETLVSQTLPRDQFGGAEMVWQIPADAPLGGWRIWDNRHYATGGFRVEEYKKPEFALEIVKPETPTALGDKIAVKIKARYYYGEPVKNAEVKYTVTREPVRETWFPFNRWDWLYGRGFWWFAPDAAILPDAENGRYLQSSAMGIEPPRGREAAPELISEQTGELDANGELAVIIDTAAALALHPDSDHRYNIKAAITDRSRRTIDGAGAALVAKKPFTVTAWSDCGFYEMPAKIALHFHAQTLDNRPALGIGVMKISQLTYAKGETSPRQKMVIEISLNQNANGDADYEFIPDEPGQYLAEYTVTPSAAASATAPKTAITGATIFTVRGDRKLDAVFNPLEIIPERAAYAVGERCRIQINTANPQATVLCFLRGENGINPPPRVLQFADHGGIVELTIGESDQPNVFVEALTVYRGKVYNVVKSIAVPPQARILNVEISPAKTRLAPAEKTELTLRLTELNGKPYQGQAVVAIYDRSVEYISGGTNIPDIKKFFWNWTRSHYGGFSTNCGRYAGNVLKKNETPMQALSSFEQLIRDLPSARSRGAMQMKNQFATNDLVALDAVALAAPAPAAGVQYEAAVAEDSAENADETATATAPPSPLIRENFADTAFWDAGILTDNDGAAKIAFTIPESLTAWKVRVWAMGRGAAVGEAETEIVTFKDYLLRLQTPRFLTVGDIATISANLHNYGDQAADSEAALSLGGEGVQRLSDRAAQNAVIPAGDEARIDWKVAAIAEGNAEITAQAVAKDGRGDAMRLTLPVNVHGIEQTLAVSGALRPEQIAATFTLDVPAKRRLDSTRLDLQFSPSLALAMLDALPYLAEYPHGCTEQTLNKFLPLVIAQATLKKLGFTLAEIKSKQINFNAQELGDPETRAAQWQKNRAAYYDPSRDQMLPFAPVFDETVVSEMVAYGVKRLAAMQCADGGWGWFSGAGEQSYPHTTALVVRGLLTARENGALIPGKIIADGIRWLRLYQRHEVAKLTAGEKWENAKTEDPDPTATIRKMSADNLDVLVFATLAQAETDEPAEFAAQRAMLKFLTRDRAQLSPYGKALFGIGLTYALKNAAPEVTPDFAEPLAEIMRNLAQFVVRDAENQTARLELGANNPWWCWYGSPIETQAAYLKLLALREPQNAVAAPLAKYLLNQRKNSARWTSTRDTALAIEALGDFIRTGEEIPAEMTVEITVDGNLIRREKITRENLFTFDNRLQLRGAKIGTGEHRIEVRRRGGGAVYFNAYLTYFSLADHIEAAGLEIKTARKVYRLLPVATVAAIAGSRGQAATQAQAKYRREELKNGDTIHSGDLLEIELLINSKNDYEYLLFRDHKFAGAEPVATESGYVGGNFYPRFRAKFSPDNAATDERDTASFSSLPAYVEYRDATVNFFIRELPRGENLLKYRARAVYPGVFSALPTEAEAMYAPELRANSEEIKLRIDDAR